MFKDIISLLPFFVCFFWTVVLSVDFKNNKTSLRLLTIFMGLSTILYFSHALFFYGYCELYARFDPLYTFALLSVYPLFYIYIKSIAKEPRISVNNLYLFIPSIIGSFLVLSTHLFFPNFIEVAGKFARLIFVVQVPLVLVYGSRLIREYHKKINEYYSSTEGRELDWLNRMLILLLFTGVLSMSAGIIGREYFAESTALLVIPSLAFSVMLFYIGHTGFSQKFSVIDFNIDSSESKSDIKDEHKDNSLGIQEKTREKLKNDLYALFAEKEIFRRTDLRITDVSAELGTNRSYISSVVNVEFNTTFTDFVNHYRVEYAKKLLLLEENHILDYIAEESGFASVNSLLRAFRKETGTTPGQFRKKR
ncbi:MAG: AraC family transcriptional regulator [Bacteroidales bacterium]|jgi:AraC-like DNA-binding protein|nr:AraC family transcriptional regulator [Bacteroidales bacterium]MDD4058214.1 AraC family transcriptional regulator [Bacteroidales bacterium]